MKIYFPSIQVFQRYCNIIMGTCTQGYEREVQKRNPQVYLLYLCYNIDTTILMLHYRCYNVDVTICMLRYLWYNIYQAKLSSSQGYKSCVCNLVGIFSIDKHLSKQINFLYKNVFAHLKRQDFFSSHIQKVS